MQAISGEVEGNKFLSFTANIFATVEDKITDTITEVSAPFEEWSYSRGIGTIPNTCQACYSSNADLYAQNCLAGLD